MASTGSSRLVVAFNGDRDKYQLPLALHEAGLLEAFVTDFYSAPDERLFGLLPSKMRSRTCAGLPASAVLRSWLSFAVQSGARLAGVNRALLFRHTDAMIARHAGRVARVRHAGLFCYSGYLPLDLKDTGTPRFIFQYHPHASYIREHFARDADLFPSWARLYDGLSDSTGPLDAAQLTDWKRADHIFCASSVTRRSLEFVGCDPSAITVVPYGLDMPDRVATPRDPGGCEFLFVGQGIPRKGLHHLLLAWSQAKLCKARLTLVCYAIDPDLKILAQQVGVRLLGRQSRDALEALYRASDVFVMPSIIEGFGLVYLEALAAGCFVIGTEETGLPDLALSADMAMSVVAGDLAGIVDALRSASERKKDGALDPGAIANAARRWSWSRFRTTIAAKVRARLATADSVCE